jgi:hypothetical protein
MIILFAVLSATWFDEIVPEPHVEPRAVLSIDDSAIESLKPRKKKIVTVYSPSSFSCPQCEKMKTDAKSSGWYAGDSDIDLHWVTGDIPSAKFYPWMVADGHSPIYGRTDISGLRLWLNLPQGKAAQAMGSVTVGKIDGKALRAFQASIPVDGVIQFGAAKFTIPKSMATQIDISPERQAVKFTSTKPRLSYGSGWLSVSQAVSSVVATRETLTIALDGFPDLVLKVE